MTYETNALEAWIAKDSWQRSKQQAEIAKVGAAIAFAAFGYDVLKTCLGWG